MAKKWIPIVIAVAVVVVAAVGYGGYTLGAQAGRTQAANTRANFLAARGQGGQNASRQGATGGAGFPGQAGSGQTGGGQFNSANFAVGQVKQIDGNTIQLSTATEVLTVKISDQTRIQKMGTGSLSDVQTGERLSIQGSIGADGTFTAQMIQIGGGLAGGNRPQAAGTPSASN